ncbi:MAG TPA: hypothetical protein VMK12_10075, partial [Anaeromyxobacteraceae bacterium]|nr:hypothetical protein [Anaeromyxobacteraceae bacterium]
MHMFCFQCQETSQSQGCTFGGACGKSEEAANFQDLLIFVLKGIALVVKAGAQADRETNAFVFEALYATITNTNFDPDRIRAYVRRGLQLKRGLLAQLAPEHRSALAEPALFDEEDEDALRRKAYLVGVLSTPDVDVRSLRETVTYALKGISAYATHARILGHETLAIGTFVLRALAAVATETSLDRLLELALET